MSPWLTTERLTAILMFFGLLSLIGAIRAKPELKGRAAVASLFMTAAFLVSQLKFHTQEGGGLDLSGVGLPLMAVVVLVIVVYVFGWELPPGAWLRERLGRREKG